MNITLFASVRSAVAHLSNRLETALSVPGEALSARLRYRRCTCTRVQQLPPAAGFTIVPRYL